MNLEVFRRGGAILVRPEAEPGNRPCQVCDATTDVQFLRFAAPRVAQKPERVVYVRLCAHCLGSLASAVKGLPVE